jgi:DNA-binding NtrC family response regulator
MPITQVVADRTRPFPGPAARPVAPRYRVLVADDERDVIHALRLLLSSEEIATLGAVTPADALSISRAHPIDAALVDLNYGPGRTTGEQGLQLVSRLRAESPRLPIVAMTAWHTGDLAREAARLGASELVEKPWDEHRLLSLIRAHAELGHARRKIASLESEIEQLRTTDALRSDAELPTMPLREIEGLLVRRALDEHRGNISRTARALGLSRAALYRRLERHGIS